MEGKITKERCGAKLVDHDGTYFCELPLGHYKHVSQKHRFEGITWTQAGADRVAREIAATRSKRVPEKTEAVTSG